MLQVQVGSNSEVDVEFETIAANGRSIQAYPEFDSYFIAREEELARIGVVLEVVFSSIKPEPREILLLHGQSGVGKSAAAKRGLRLMQDLYSAASCSKDVFIPRIIRGESAADVREDLARWGYDLGSKLGVSSSAHPDTVLPLLKLYLAHVRYIVLIENAHEVGLQEALKHIPPSNLPCALLVTSEVLQLHDLYKLVCTAESSLAGFNLFLSSINVLDMHPFTAHECMQLLQMLCPFEMHEILHTHATELGVVYDELARLPMTVRIFGIWLRDSYRVKVDLAKQNAKNVFKMTDELSLSAVVANDLLFEWSTTAGSVPLSAGIDPRE